MSPQAGVSRVTSRRQATGGPARSRGEGDRDGTARSAPTAAAQFTGFQEVHVFERSDGPRTRAPMSSRTGYRIVLLITGCLVATAQGCSCSGDSSTEPEPEPVVTRVTVTLLGPATIRVGETVDLDALATNAEGGTITTTYSWSSSDESVATVVPLQNHNARVTAVGVGQATITVTEGSRSLKGSTTISVQPPALSEIRVLLDDPAIPLGGNRKLTAEAIGADGSPVVVPLIWSSSDEAVGTVAWDPQSSHEAVVTGVAEGTATISVREPSQPAIEGTATVTVLPAKGVIRGILYDVDDVTPLDSIYLTMGPVAGSTGCAAKGRTGRQNTGDPVPVPAGGYRFEVDPGQCALFSVGVLGSRWIQTPGDTAFVLSGQTTIRDLSVKRGYHLDMLGTDVNVAGAAGSQINLVVSYRAWNRDLCPGCVPSLGIGVDGTPLAVYRFGIPGVYPGKTEQSVSIPITVPAQGGTLYAMLVTTSTGASIQPGLDQYASVWANNLQGSTFIRIGTLVVN